MSVKYRGRLAFAANITAPNSPLEDSMLDLEFAQLSDTGRVREHNEDYLGYVLPETSAQARTHGWLFALADGVGGNLQGEVASRTAVESLLTGFQQAKAGEAHTSLLPRLVQAANVEVHEAGLAASVRGASMATTIVACAVRFDRLVVAHVGDSRCYLIRRGQARLLTSDHTVANEQIRLGLLSSPAGKHVLSRSLGGELFVHVDMNEHLLLPDDILVLCSDGLHGAVAASDLIRLTSGSAGLKAAAQQLVALANERDGGDNVSLQLVRIRDVERVGMYRGRPYKLRS